MRNVLCQCGDQCDQTVAFNCRSFTFFPSSGSCRLSSDDTHLTSGGPGALVSRPGAMYYQRGPCLERECLVIYWAPGVMTREQRMLSRRQF